MDDYIDFRLRFPGAPDYRCFRIAIDNNNIYRHYVPRLLAAAAPTHMHYSRYVCRRVRD